MAKNKKPDNVVQFPNIHIDNPPLSASDVSDRLLRYKESYSTELAEILWENVLGEMTRAGCDFDSQIDKYFPSMILIFEAIKSLHSLTMGLEHPLQRFAEENVVIMESGETQTVGGLKKDLQKTVDNDEEID